MKPAFLFHPLFIHFPIALYFMEFWLLAAWRWKEDELYRRMAGILFHTGYVFTVFSALTGWLDAGGWSRMSEPTRQHFYAAIIALAVCTFRFFHMRFAAASRPAGFLSACFVGNGAVIYAAYLGGRLVY